MHYKDLIEKIDFEELSHLKLPPSMQRLLDTQGYKLLGSGAGGAAFGKTNDPYILKVGKLSDGWWEWANWITNKSFDCLPRIKSLRKYNENIYMVVMEKLKPINNSFTKTNTWYGYCSWMLLKTKDKTFQEIYLSKIPMDKIKTFADNFERDNQCIVTVLEHIINEFSNYHLDLYGIENFMLRGTTLVITDPISRKK